MVSANISPLRARSLSGVTVIIISPLPAIISASFLKSLSANTPIIKVIFLFVKYKSIESLNSFIAPGLWAPSIINKGESFITSILPGQLAFKSPFSMFSSTLNP